MGKPELSPVISRFASLGHGLLKLTNTWSWCYSPTSVLWLSWTLPSSVLWLSWALLKCISTFLPRSHQFRPSCSGYPWTSPNWTRATVKVKVIDGLSTPSRNRNRRQRVLSRPLQPSIAIICHQSYTHHIRCKRLYVRDIHLTLDSQFSISVK